LCLCQKWRKANKKQADYFPAEMKTKEDVFGFEIHGF
jgi:hypothetical protein